MNKWVIVALLAMALAILSSAVALGGHIYPAMVLWLMAAALTVVLAFHSRRR